MPVTAPKMECLLMNALKMKRLIWVAGLLAVANAAYAGQTKPNVLFVMADDMGYGDVQSLNPERGKIPTPYVDQLAAEGMVFTDAHSGSSVCTPTRYGLLTGRYSWRTRLQQGVTQGYQPNLIAPGRATVASFLQDQGYHSAIIGKWHLDFQYQDPSTGELLKKPKNKNTLPPVGARIPDGPITRGFDTYHGFHHARDMKAVIDDDTVILYDDEINMLPRLERKAVEYIEERAKNPDQPFFLYVPLGSPHTPILPTEQWQGKSGINAYADFVMQTDAAFGAMLQALRDTGLDDNTLVIFTSDNGCSKAANFSELEKAGHHASAHLRGAKSDIWDGGHRVPFVVRWPGKVEAGTDSDQLICLTDLMATLADITGASLPPDSAEDSVSFLPALSGEPIASTRAGVIHHSIKGHFAYRMGPWKLCLARASGGWSSPNEKNASADAPKAQLYDMENDPAETTNLYETKPDVVARLLEQLEADVAAGRSTDGAAASNDTNKIRIWKSERKKNAGR